MKRPCFREGIKKLVDLAADQTTCIMCSEKTMPYAIATT